MSFASKVESLYSCGVRVLGTYCTLYVYVMRGMYTYFIFFICVAKDVHVYDTIFAGLECILY